ncbi:TetR/AcrR family transcriptional regulator [Rhodococcus sp. 06-470-2]|uniref:TetR/AcrR family transcriptional regulator n=1 Tax=unclassified Rhodococcus (in: high G+C Gram-positive bacteria) TaxID=192944 RepID=UPI0005EB7D38|nr:MULTISPECIES: TetR/AcrR family transcriptional regulator [unclassified Rhodococcus (in: high G+C Gram-positive bacteria)]OZC59851.1 TetR/AcrR family transcriptional regulator [Rhodococcus sp. 06-470-2]OZE08335.1 TetR/AcrR family transcriptional regulator [Rhodococcus sp. 05-2255-3B1]OZE11628.1 TetR/AcrR family transcriptional regulator [Rhodococcus sp. 05-2255-3C]OZE23166.1 TetR/AcrR family transcriptional regulator [Rhodococcus sp. 05-2255-2A2]OZE61099.1 TetR/AcrR family transcriptional re
MTTPRKRMTPTQRRAQLLEIGSALFAERPYEDVWIEEVADLAGVSRGLMYHYFPSKREFFVEVVRTESERNLDLTAPDTSLPVLEQIAAGLDAYISYTDEHAHGVRAVNRGSLLGDRRIDDILRREFEIQQERILAALPEGFRDDEIVRTALRGWVAFVRAVCLDWVERRTLSREQVRAVCLRAVAGLLEV